ncbi:MAG: class I tRNA ligase family protein, partial [Lutibacter sp.]|nr:class I tRNA ligase family protein [Lutibacter sp.]
FIVDFVCLSKRLIIEVDGKIHESQIEKDLERTKILENKGYKVIRLTNEEVIGNIDEIVSKIIIELEKRPGLSEGKGANENIEVLPLGKDLGWEIPVFTTRPDTIFGVSFMTLAPEHDLVPMITTPEQKEAVEAYVKATAKRSELERMADVKTISGVFTGAYALHPFSGKKIPIWIGDYVLAGYGTGAVMAVPCGDQRDYDFAKHFNLEIPNIFEGVDISEGAFTDKENSVIANSDFLNGLPYKKAMKRIIHEMEQRGCGCGKINYRLRDAVFSRQRYWGEPFPVYYKNGLPQMIDLKYLPIVLPEVEKYLPTEDGKPPLGNATFWAWDTEKSAVVSNQLIDHKIIFPLELNTMPGWAGSSSYFNRYMDPHNNEEFVSKEAVNYWQDVDLYIGGSEHATGHLLYSRFWQKFLFDKGIVPVDEYAKKLINQGMIMGMSAFVYRWEYGLQSDSINLARKPIYISKGLIEKAIKSGLMVSEISEDLKKLYSGLIDFHKSLGESPAEWSYFTPIHADVSFVNASDELDVEAFKKWRPEYKDAIFIGESGKVLPFG